MNRNCLFLASVSNSQAVKWHNKVIFRLNALKIFLNCSVLLSWAYLTTVSSCRKGTVFSILCHIYCLLENVHLSRVTQFSRADTLEEFFF